jgi:hypothetical protein
LSISRRTSVLYFPFRAVSPITPPEKSNTFWARAARLRSEGLPKEFVETIRTG